MKRWARISNGTVDTVVEQADTPQIEGTWVECGNAGPGWTYNGSTFAPPASLSWASATLDPRYWWVDVGPFFDRFGAKALSITSSTDAQVQGLVSLLLPRKYVDLKRADLPAMLDLLVSKGLITGAEKATVLTTPTSDYERHIKGLEQPV